MQLASNNKQSPQGRAAGTNSQNAAAGRPFRMLNIAQNDVGNKPESLKRPADVSLQSSASGGGPSVQSPAVGGALRLADHQVEPARSTARSIAQPGAGVASPFSSPLASAKVMPGWWALHAPVFNVPYVKVSEGVSAEGRWLRGGEIGRAGLVYPHISSRDNPKASSRPLPVPVFRLHPHPERRTAVAVAVVNPGGLAVKRQDKVGIHARRGGGERDVVRGRSRASRRRLMDKLTRVDMRKLASERKNARAAKCLFDTLTFPAEFPTWEEAKRDLQAFRKRVERAWPMAWALWLDEYQTRGAPHFHLVIVFEDPVNVWEFRRWQSRAWYEVVGSDDPKHLRAGTQAVPLHLAKGVGSLMGYLSAAVGELSKQRQARPVDIQTGELLETGRTWGFWNQDAVPFETLAVIVFKTLEAWAGFKGRVSEHFEKSPYLRHVAEAREWAGALLYGDGWELLKILTEGLPGVELREVTA